MRRQLSFTTNEISIPSLRWWIASLVFQSTVINYIDRQTLAVLSPQLTKELVSRISSMAGYHRLSDPLYGYVP